MLKALFYILPLQKEKYYMSEDKDVVVKRWFAKADNDFKNIENKDLILTKIRL